MSRKVEFDDSWMGYYFIPFVAIFAYYIGGDLPFYNTSFETIDLIYISLNIMSGLIIWKIIKKIMFTVILEEITLLLFLKAFILNLSASLFFLIFTRYLHDFIIKIQTEIEFYTIDLPTNILFILIINLIYLILFYKSKLEQKPDHKVVPIESSQKIIIQSNKKSYSLFPSNIAFIGLEHSVCFLYTYTGEKIATAQTLNQIFQKLPATFFFQANRQFVLHRDAIQSYQLTDTRKLKIQLVPILDVNKEIYISKGKSSTFKNWYLNDLHSNNKISMLKDS